MSSLSNIFFYTHVSMYYMTHINPYAITLEAQHRGRRGVLWRRALCLREGTAMEPCPATSGSAWAEMDRESQSS